MKQSTFRQIKNFLFVILGCASYGLGFSLFLQPNHMNAGGVSGLSQLVAHITGFGSVPLWSVLFNIPLFILSIRGVGKKFFWGSLLGMVLTNTFISVFAAFPSPVYDPLLACLYGGLLTGFGVGLVFVSGCSTGGVDILARLLRPAFPNFPIGRIMLCVDLVIVALTGVVFGDINKALYSAITLYLCDKVLDSVVYGLDYSTVALIVSDHHKVIAQQIIEKLHRGVTVLNGHGSYTGQEKQVLLTAIKKRQAAELKNLIIDIDPHAFIILQESHQVLGEGFKRYNKNDL